MIVCDEVLTSLQTYAECSIIDGSARVRTHCLYPSFEPVVVMIQSVAGGFQVSDGGNAYAIAWDHGRDERSALKALGEEARRFQIEVQGVNLTVRAPSNEWLEPAILAVANGSAHAAMSAVRKFAIATEGALKERIGAVLRARVSPLFEVSQEFQAQGLSGKEHRFDFAVRSRDHLLLIDAVAPHHSSISHRFVAFSDTRRAEPASTDAFAVYDKPLDPDDAALITQVADLVPFASLEMGTLRTMARQSMPHG